MPDLYHSPVMYHRTHSWPSGMSAEEALEKAKERAEQGDPLFMVLFSIYLAKKSDSNEHLELSKKWLSNGLSHNNADAYCLAGMAFLNGDFGEHNPCKALELYDKAGEISKIKGNYCKGKFYLLQHLKNTENKASYRQAGRYFRDAAKQGHATSLYMYLYCASKNPVYRIIKIYSAAIFYLFRRVKHSGPQRWWCYMDLQNFRPSTVIFAETQGHALGYYSKNNRT